MVLINLLIFCFILGILDSDIYQIPSTWEKSKNHKIRFTLSSTGNEYKSIVSKFDQVMNEKCTEIIRIERIQNERWYTQYIAHRKDFRKRLNIDTERRLYHGCSEKAANSIIEEGFNRSFAGVNGKFYLSLFIDIYRFFLSLGTKYGVGVYFSTNAAYSHGYTIPNASEERCMFIARVLVGKTILGDISMKTRPVGFDSTTDNKHIFVTYHDAQAFAEYLITYK